MADDTKQADTTESSKSSEMAEVIKFKQSEGKFIKNKPQPKVEKEQTKTEPEQKKQEKDSRRENDDDSNKVESDLSDLDTENEDQEEEESKSEKKPVNKDLENATKRLRDKDRYITDLRKQIKDLEAAKERHSKLLNQFEDALDFDESGLPVKWNFEKAEKRKADNVKPPMPTKEEWADDPESAYEKRRAVEKWEERQEALKAKEADEISKRDKEFEENLNKTTSARSKAWDKSYEDAVILYPDFNLEKSKLRKRADEIFQERKEEFVSDNGEILDTGANLKCAIQAAEELGIDPNVSFEPKKREEKKADPGNKKPSMMNLGTGNNNGTSSNPELEKILRFKSDEGKFLKRK